MLTELFRQSGLLYCDGYLCLLVLQSQHLLQVPKVLLADTREKHYKLLNGDNHKWVD